MEVTTDRLAVGTITVGIGLLSWLVVIVGPSAPVSGSFQSLSFLLFVGVWGVGMVAMMLPSLLPMLFLIVSASRKETSSLGRIGHPFLFALGYFGIWSFVGVLAYFGLVYLFATYVPFASLGRLAGLTAAVAVFLAGVYQFSPLKRKALEACRSPMNFVMTRWKEGSSGAVQMGLDYGFFCTKCCWAFMAVLVVVGAMNLLWMILFAGVIFVEKVAPRGALVSKGLGVLLMTSGVVLALIP